MRFLHLFTKCFHGSRLFFSMMEAQGVPRKSGSFGGAGKASHNLASKSHAHHGYSPLRSIDSSATFPRLSATHSGGQLPACGNDKSVVDQIANKISTAEVSMKTLVEPDMPSCSSRGPVSQIQGTYSKSKQFGGMDPQRPELQNMNPLTNPGSSQPNSQFSDLGLSETDFPTLSAATSRGKGRRLQVEREKNGKSERARPASHKPEGQVTVRSSDQAQADVSLAEPQGLPQEVNNVLNLSAQTQVDAPQLKRSVWSQKNTSVPRASAHGKLGEISFTKAVGEQNVQNGGYSRTEQRTIRQRDEQQDGSQEDNEADLDALGRMLTRILRHQADKFNLKIRSDGFVDVRDILSLSAKTTTKKPISTHTVDDVLLVVKRDKKQRLGITKEEGKLLIRAHQGHTIEGVESEDLLKPVKSPEDVPVCVHGTFKRHVNDILKDGLKRMTRRHVHFATGEYGSKDVISGMRSSCDVLIFLNVKKALSEGMKLYKSENGVILTEGFNGVVPADYFTKVMDLKSGKTIHSKVETNESSTNEFKGQH